MELETRWIETDGQAVLDELAKYQLQYKLTHTAMARKLGISYTSWCLWRTRGRAPRALVMHVSHVTQLELSLEGVNGDA